MFMKFKNTYKAWDLLREETVWVNGVESGDIDGVPVVFYVIDVPEDDLHGNRRNANELDFN